MASTETTVDERVAKATLALAEAQKTIIEEALDKLLACSDFVDAFGVSNAMRALEAARVERERIIAETLGLLGREIPAELAGRLAETNGESGG